MASSLSSSTLLSSSSNSLTTCSNSRTKCSSNSQHLAASHPWEVWVECSNSRQCSRPSSARAPCKHQLNLSSRWEVSSNRIISCSMGYRTSQAPWVAWASNSRIKCSTTCRHNNRTWEVVALVHSSRPCPNRPSSRLTNSTTAASST